MQVLAVGDLVFRWEDFLLFSGGRSFSPLKDIKLVEGKRRHFDFLKFSSIIQLL